MQAVYALIGVIILGGIVYYFMSTDAPGTQDAAQEAPEETVNAGTEDIEVETSPVEDETADTGNVPMDDTSDVADSNDDEAVTDTEDTEDTEATETEEPEERVFNIDGFNFDFSVDEIRVEEGDTVTVNLTSTDGFHDFVVDEFDAATERVQTGETASVTFVADKAGTYEFYCSVGNHREMGMVGTLVVE